MILRTAALSMALLFCVSCNKKEAPPPSPVTSAAPSPVASAAPPAVQAPAGSPPADGKYERVTVNGALVPMIHVTNKGAVVLVDTDGSKPRSWEEQYKRKGELPAGQFNVHKTNTNKNDTFEDDAIDKEGLWIIDAKGNITKP